MQKEYCVNEQMKRNLISEMKVMQMPVMRKWIYMCRFLYILIWSGYFVVTLIILMQAIQQFQIGYSADAWAVLVMDVFVLAIALFLSIIPYMIKQSADRRYMWKWCARRSEIVQLQNKSIVWMRKDINLGRYYWEHQILYKDIKRIEYSVREKILYVYGYMSAKEWDSPEREECFDTLEVDRTMNPIPWMTLPAYFENFEQLKINLCQLTGLVIIEK